MDTARNCKADTACTCKAGALMNSWPAAVGCGLRFAGGYTVTVRIDGKKTVYSGVRSPERNEDP
jgi:hypothetical protein